MYTWPCWKTDTFFLAGGDVRQQTKGQKEIVWCQDGGEAAFNQIAALLERMERVKDQWTQRERQEPGPGAPSSAVPVASLPASALASASSQGGAGGAPAPAPAPSSGGFPATVAVASGGFAAESPVASAPSSEDLWRNHGNHGQGSQNASFPGPSGMGPGSEKERKKKRKEGREKEREPKEKGDDGAFPDSFAQSAWPDSSEAFATDFGAWGATPAFDGGMTWAGDGPSFAAFGSQGSAPPDDLRDGLEIKGIPVAEDTQLQDLQGLAQCTQVSLHIQFPYAALDDKDSFERLFVRAAAQAAGVAPQRIRVRAIRPG